jgi:hypothetical protein
MSRLLNGRIMRKWKYPNELFILFYILCSIWSDTITEEDKCGKCHLMERSCLPDLSYEVQYASLALISNYCRYTSTAVSIITLNKLINYFYITFNICHPVTCFILELYILMTSRSNLTQIITFLTCIRVGPCSGLGRDISSVHPGIQILMRLLYCTWWVVSEELYKLIFKVKGKVKVTKDRHGPKLNLPHNS